MKDEKALVTGCAGFIGSHLVERLTSGGWHVVGIDNLSAGAYENISHLDANSTTDEKEFEFIEGDVRDSSFLNEAVKGCDAVFHLAAQSSVPGSSKNLDEDFDINVKGTLEVLKATLKERNRKEKDIKVVYASTSTVYGTTENLPTPEEESIAPISFYGASKASAEAYCFAFAGTHSLPAVSLRLYNVYGPRNRKGVMWDFFRKLNEDPEHLEILGTGKQEKDYIYIDDAIDAFITALKNGKPGEAYNVGSGTSHSVNNIAKEISDLMDIEPEFSYTGGKGWKGDVERTLADISKMRNIGWGPNTSFDEGMEKFYNWYVEDQMEE